jgi:hypothetical protein
MARDPARQEQVSAVQVAVQVVALAEPEAALEAQAAVRSALVRVPVWVQGQVRLVDLEVIQAAGQGPILHRRSNKNGPTKSGTIFQFRYLKLRR